MTYQQALEFIHGIARFGSKPGLDRVRGLLERIGNPQKKLRFIHVAGTNGKGSVCAMLSRALSQAGYRTGLYISPYVLEFRERIQINGEMIPPKDLADCTEFVKSHWDIMDANGCTPSEFETLVAVAFEYFLRRNVDVVVLEVGMGGRHDATNAIDAPLVSVITSLSLEHTEYLGDTIDKIAMEKCGIIKPGGITVCYPVQQQAALDMIRSRCEQEQNQLRIPEQAQVLEMDFFGSRIRYRNLELKVPLIGEHQVLNASVVLETLRAVGERGFPVSDGDIIEGIAKTGFPARLEIFSRNPLVVLDGAHNPSGAEVLGKALDMLKGRDIHAVMGMLGNKDVPASLGCIMPHCKSLCAVPVPGNPLSMEPQKLAELARPLCPSVEVYHDPVAAADAVLARCRPDDVMLVCGSLYLASHLRPTLEKMNRS